MKLTFRKLGYYGLSFIGGAGMVFTLYLAGLKLLDMYDMSQLPDENVHAYCLGVRRWGMDEVCHCYEIHGRPCYGDRAMGSLDYIIEVMKEDVERGM